MRTIIYALANLVQTAILNFKMAMTKYGYSPYLSLRVLCSPGPMFPESYVGRGGGGGVEQIVANIAIDVGI